MSLKNLSNFINLNDPGNNKTSSHLLEDYTFAISSALDKPNEKLAMVEPLLLFDFAKALNTMSVSETSNAFS